MSLHCAELRLARRLLEGRSVLAHGRDRFDPAIDALMTRRPITIAPSESVAAAATRMRTCRVRHLPVVSTGMTPALVGLLSLRDVIAADEQARVADAMTRDPESALPETELTVACRSMLAAGYSCLPVAEGNRLVGIFTATDALRFAVMALDEEGRAIHRAPDVAQLMSARPLATVEPATPLWDAWQLMQERGIRHLPVLANGAIAGILSDRDILAAGRDWLDRTAPERHLAMVAADAMSTRVSTIGADQPAADAADILLRRRVGALPVRRGHELRGIITVADFMYWILGRA